MDMPQLLRTSTVAIVTEGSGEDVEFSVGFGRVQTEDMRDPRIQVHILKWCDGLTGHNVRAGGKEAGFHLRHGMRVEAMLTGDRRCVRSACGQRVSANRVRARGNDDRVAFPGIF